MTPTEINVAIAQVRGENPRFCPTHHSYECCGRRLTDYCHDLNAMHEAESKIINRGLYEKWLPILMAAACNEETWGTAKPSMNNLLCLAYMANATAPQRAEAFLRTIGKWKEDTK